MRQYMIMTLQHTAPLACRLKGPEAWHLWLVTLASVLHMVLLTFYVFFCLTDVSQEGSVYVYIHIYIYIYLIYIYGNTLWPPDGKSETIKCRSYSSVIALLR